jgi:hypothetical protein
MLSLPSELTDHILSFCPGHIRADLNVKNISVRLRKNNYTYKLNKNILLKQIASYYQDGSAIYFVNKANTDNIVGYISKMVKTDSILYTWVKIVYNYPNI